MSAEISDDTIIHLESSDGKTFQVGYKIVKQSCTLKNMLEDLGGADDESPIPIPVVDGPVWWWRFRIGVHLLQPAAGRRCACGRLAGWPLGLAGAALVDDIGLGGVGDQHARIAGNALLPAIVAGWFQRVRLCGAVADGRMADARLAGARLDPCRTGPQAVARAADGRAVADDLAEFQQVDHTLSAR